MTWFLIDQRLLQASQISIITHAIEQCCLFIQPMSNSQWIVFDKTRVIASSLPCTLSQCLFYPVRVWIVQENDFDIPVNDKIIKVNENETHPKNLESVLFLYLAEFYQLEQIKWDSNTWILPRMHSTMQDKNSSFQLKSKQKLIESNLEVAQKVFPINVSVEVNENEIICLINKQGRRIHLAYFQNNWHLVELNEPIQFNHGSSQEMTFLLNAAKQSKDFKSFLDKTTPFLPIEAWSPTKHLQSQQLYSLLFQMIETNKFVPISHLSLQDKLILLSLLEQIGSPLANKFRDGCHIPLDKKDYESCMKYWNMEERDRQLEQIPREKEKEAVTNLLERNAYLPIQVTRTAQWLVRHSTSEKDLQNSLA